jgi:opacity protein-like surface antigen
MNRLMIVAAAVAAAALALAAPAPAFAGYGALAHDQASGKFGLSWDKPTQREADDAAMKDCAETSCKIVFRSTAHQCGAIATALKEGSTAWGAGLKNSRADAELAAVTGCQKRTEGQCKLRASGCNR